MPQGWKKQPNKLHQCSQEPSALFRSISEVADTYIEKVRVFEELRVCVHVDPEACRR